ncbi:hypothetical protein M4D73_29530 [Streptomyces pseudogriseolus]|uniref:hypothetical protein n=1 Tax=Streptomyces pseudogriseolus TaxID=36817 RepID=UPI0034796A21|nr:hypothetical protein [Streptomyces pseudogriseolus]
MTEPGEGDVDARLHGSVTACDGFGEVGGARRVGAGDRVPAGVRSAEPQGEEAAEARHVAQGGGDGRR